MPGLLPSFESVARIAVAMLVNSLWQGALIALATWGALRLFPKANASTRYAAWGLALLAMVVIPIATSLSRVSIAPSASAITTPYHATKPGRRAQSDGRPGWRTHASAACVGSVEHRIRRRACAIVPPDHSKRRRGGGLRGVGSRRAARTCAPDRCVRAFGAAQR